MKAKAPKLPKWYDVACFECSKKLRNASFVGASAWKSAHKSVTGHAEYELSPVSGLVAEAEVAYWSNCE